MNNQYKKIVFLIAILAIPSAIYLFLASQGKNTYKIQVFNPKSEMCPPTNSADTMHRIPPFRLLTQDNQVFTEKNLEGKIYVADFFFTRCPNICLVMTSELTRVQEAFQDREDVAIVSHSIDPLYDSTHILKQYGDKYKANYKFWTFVTGDSAAMYNLAQCGYFIAARKSEDSQLLFDHSDKLVLIDKEKRIRGFYAGTKREEVDRLIMELQILLKEYQQK